MNRTQTQPRAGRHNKTTLSLEQFQALEKRVQVVSEAINALEDSLMELIDTSDDTDTTRRFLATALCRVDEAKGIQFIPYWWHPQPEWTGGDSSDPKNTVWNEPHIVSALLK